MNHIADCPGLPGEFTHLTTTTTFPVSPADEVVVKCADENLLLSGSSVFTCIDEYKYHYQSEPTCEASQFKRCY